jgi:hypothetical protein
MKFIKRNKGISHEALFRSTQRFAKTDQNGYSTQHGIRMKNLEQEMAEEHSPLENRMTCLAKAK